MPFRKRLMTVLGITFVAIGTDQFTKMLAMAWLRGRPPESYFGDIFRWDYAENTGAFLSLGATLSSPARFWLLSVAVAGFLGALLFFLLTSPMLKRAQIYCLAAVFGGGVSNLIDRFFRPQGRVVDFMNMGIGGLRTGVFNIADMLILFGIIVLAIYNSFEKETVKRPS